MPIIQATWTGTEYQTVSGWHSTDGDSWTDGAGLPVETAEFNETTITLSGGPRDGERVS